MVREQLRPNLDVPILHFGEAPKQILLLDVGLRVSEKTIEVRCICFVLPMVLERVQIRSRGVFAVRSLGRRKCGQ